MGSINLTDILMSHFVHFVTFVFPLILTSFSALEATHFFPHQTRESFIHAFRIQEVKVIVIHSEQCSLFKYSNHYSKTGVFACGLML